MSRGLVVVVQGVDSGTRFVVDASSSRRIGRRPTSELPDREAFWSLARWAHE